MMIFAYPAQIGHANIGIIQPGDLMTCTICDPLIKAAWREEC